MTIRFAERQTLRIFDVPVGLDAQPLFAAAVTSWDCKVFDLDRPRDAIDTPVYELLGQDPAGTNADSGLPFFGTALRTGEGWTADSNGFGFVYDLNTALFDPLGGRGYRIELTYSTAAHGERTTILKAECIGRQGVV